MALKVDAASDDTAVGGSDEENTPPLTLAISKNDFCALLHDHVKAADREGKREVVSNFFSRFEAAESILVPLNLFCDTVWNRQHGKKISDLLLATGDVRAEVETHLAKNIPQDTVVFGICTSLLRPTGEETNEARKALREFLEASSHSEEFAAGVVKLCKQIWLAKTKQIMKESEEHEAKLKKMADEENINNHHHGAPEGTPGMAEL